MVLKVKTRAGSGTHIVEEEHFSSFHAPEEIPIGLQATSVSSSLLFSIVRHHIRDCCNKFVALTSDTTRLSRVHKWNCQHNSF